MIPQAAVNTSNLHWFLLPLLIFLARVCDVSIGTIRILLISRGRKFFASSLGFIEILIWLLAIRQIMYNLGNVFTYLAFAGGFSMGNFVGMYIEEKLALGAQVIRVITHKDATELVNYLNSQGYGVTTVDARGSTGKVNIVFMVVNRRELNKVIEAVKRFNPKAFYSIEEVRSVSEGVFPLKKNNPLSRLWAGFKRE